VPSKSVKGFSLNGDFLDDGPPTTIPCGLRMHPLSAKIRTMQS